jgi:hypothetical protein
MKKNESIDLKVETKKLEVLWNKEKLDPRLIGLLHSLYQKLALSNAKEFKKYWPKAFAFSKEILMHVGYDLFIYGLAYNFLAFDSFLKFKIVDAKNYANKAINNDFFMAEDMNMLFKHLENKRVILEEKNLNIIMKEIEEYLILFSNFEKELALAECHRYSRHLGLMYNKDKLIKNAKVYLDMVSEIKK